MVIKNKLTIEMLDKARGYANTPFKLTSTWRSVEKNNSLKNSSKNRCMGS